MEIEKREQRKKFACVEANFIRLPNEILLCFVEDFLCYRYQLSLLVKIKHINSTFYFSSDIRPGYQTAQ